jgi:DNA adenine methylase
MNNYIVATEQEIIDADIHIGLRKINTPFGYFGSKNKIALQICTSLPPHNCWVEVFCGSAALTLSKTKAPIEVINDIDHEIVNFFHQLRDNNSELLRLIQYTPYAEEELNLARHKDGNLSDIERARRFLVQSMMAINGVFGDERGGFSYSDSYSRNGHEARVNRWNNLPDRLSIVVERLKSVRIENKDARKIIKRFTNRPATLLYLDPPYLGDRTNGYNMDANNEKFHIELLNLANKANCMIFISGYENELYDSILTEELGWTTKQIETSTKGSNGASYSRTEVLWMNKNFTDALEKDSVPISLTDEEKKQKKVNPERK